MKEQGMQEFQGITMLLLSMYEIWLQQHGHQHNQRTSSFVCMKCFQMGMFEIMLGKEGAT